MLTLRTSKRTGILEFECHHWDTGVPRNVDLENQQTNRYPWLEVSSLRYRKCPEMLTLRTSKRTGILDMECHHWDTGSAQKCWPWEPSNEQVSLTWSVITEIQSVPRNVDLENQQKNGNPWLGVSSLRYRECPEMLTLRTSKRTDILGLECHHGDQCHICIN